MKRGISLTGTPWHEATRLQAPGWRQKLPGNFRMGHHFGLGTVRGGNNQIQGTCDPGGNDHHAVISTNVWWQHGPGREPALGTKHLGLACDGEDEPKVSTPQGCTAPSHPRGCMVPCHDVPCHAVPHCAMPSHATSSNAMQCCATQLAKPCRAMVAKHWCRQGAPRRQRVLQASARRGLEEESQLFVFKAIGGWGRERCGGRRVRSRLAGFSNPLVHGGASKGGAREQPAW